MDFANLLKEKTNKRCEQLNELGLKFNFQYDSFLLLNSKAGLNVHTSDITCMSDEKWDKMIVKFKEIIAEENGNKE